MAIFEELNKEAHYNMRHIVASCWLDFWIIWTAQRDNIEELEKQNTGVVILNSILSKQQKKNKWNVERLNVFPFVISRHLAYCQ